MNAVHKLMGGVALLAVLGTAAAAPVPAGTSAGATRYVPGEVLVRFKPATSAWSRGNTLSAFAASTRPLGKSPYVLVKLNPAYGDVPSVVASLAAEPNVQSAQPNYIYHSLSTTPDDTYYRQQWGLENSGQTVSGGDYSTDNPGTAGDDIDAKQAWGHITDCSGVTVAVLDTGINYTQKDLAANMWNGGTAYPHHGYDEVDNDNDPMPTGGAEQHGTHVAGIIGADGNNALGVSGVCWKASIMSVRVLNAQGIGSTSTVSSGIDFAVDHGAKVINMSLGGTSGDPAVSDAISYAQSHGVVVVAAAGNDGQDNDTTPFYPCDDTQDNLICVAALDQAYSLASFSDYGPTSVDVGAPGTNVLSTWGGPILDKNQLNGWTISSGWKYYQNSYTTPVLEDPADYPLGQYTNNADDTAWKNFDLSITTYPSVFAEALTYDAQGQTQLDHDYFNSAYIAGNANPFGSSGTQLRHVSGTIDYPEAIDDISPCLKASSCSLGFQLTSDASTTGQGVLVGYFQIETQQTNASVYHVLSGTSMATPFVSGIAAMVFAYNPQDDYHDVVNAILNGGTADSALSNMTTTGDAVNAMGALAYLSPPTGVSATVQ